MSVNSKMTAIADKVRVLHGTDARLGLDDMAEMVDAANVSIDEQAEMIAQLGTKLEGKSVPNNAALQAKGVTPSAEEQIVTPDSGKFALSKVVVAGDEDLIAANIKRGVEIFGVTGKYNGPASSGSTADTADLVANGDDYSVDGIAQKSLYKARLPLGTTVQLEYTGQGQFLHWVNTIDGKVQGGGAKAFSVTLSKNATFTPVLLSDALPGAAAPYSAYIEFMSEYNQIMGAGTWSNADNPQLRELPPVASKISANSLGWTLDGETVCTAQDIINSIDGSFAYKEIRGLYEDVVVPVTITVGNNLDDTTFTVQGTRGKNTKLQKPAQGYEAYDVHYWSWDREGKRPLCTQTAYYHYSSHNNTVYIQYVPAGTVVERPSYITIEGMMTTGRDDGLGITTIILRQIDGTVRATGALYATDGDVQEETAEQTMVLGSSAVTTTTSTSTSKFTAYLPRVALNTEDTVLWIRGYCVYADSNGVEHTIYTKVYNHTYAELMAAEKFPL